MITAAIATAVYGGVAVLHSSGVVIATGTAGYIAGTLGSIGLGILYAIPF